MALNISSYYDPSAIIGEVVTPAAISIATVPDVLAGIRALGYDDGYTELWELIADKFSTDAIIPTSDTIFDTGGPSLNF